MSRKIDPLRTPDEEFELPLIEEPAPKRIGTQAVKVSLFKRGDEPTSPWQARVREDGDELRISTRSTHRGTAMEFARLLYRGVLYAGGIEKYQEVCARERAADKSLRNRLANRPPSV